MTLARGTEGPHKSDTDVTVVCERNDSFRAGRRFYGSHKRIRARWALACPYGSGDATAFGQADASRVRVNEFGPFELWPAPTGGVPRLARGQHPQGRLAFGVFTLDPGSGPG